MIARALARLLERGVAGPGFGAIASLWGERAPILRPLAIPRGVRIVCVGGATLGGSGKTPLAIGCARALADAGHRVAFVGHAHRARVVQSRRVGDVSAGDEAWEAANALGDVPVYVGPTRQAAVDLAARVADVLVIDGPLNLRPTRAHLALLAVDGRAPFGSGACLPAGDLRASVERLREASDVVVAVGTNANSTVAHYHAPLTRFRLRTHGQDDAPLEALRGTTVDVATAIARPDRFLDTLRTHGIDVRRHLQRADHDRSPLPAGRWLVPRKNAHWADPRRGGPRTKVTWVEYDIDLPLGLRELLQIATGRDPRRERHSVQAL